jgi:peptidoglycan-N-acetylglucosamine deacetylase
MAYVVIKSVFSAIQGIKVEWNKLKQMGSVEQSLGQNEEYEQKRKFIS